MIHSNLNNLVMHVEDFVMSFRLSQLTHHVLFECTNCSKHREMLAGSLAVP